MLKIIEKCFLVLSYRFLGDDDNGYLRTLVLYKHQVKLKEMLDRMWLQLCDAFQNKTVELLDIFKSNPTDWIRFLKRGCGVANTAQYEAAELPSW